MHSLHTNHDLTW